MAGVKVPRMRQDKFIQEWQTTMDSSTSALNYRICQTKLGFEDYLISLPYEVRHVFVNIQTRFFKTANI